MGRVDLFDFTDLFYVRINFAVITDTENRTIGNGEKP